jgi:hypothetical protein
MSKTSLPHYQQQSNPGLGAGLENDIYEEMSFGNFANLQDTLDRAELFNGVGDCSMLEAQSSVYADGVALPTVYQQHSDVESEKYRHIQEEHLKAQDTIRQLRQRLVRRTAVIDGIRKYYLRDVVTMKYILKEMLDDTERREAWKIYEHTLPSIDLKVSLNVDITIYYVFIFLFYLYQQPLELHAPEKCAFQVIPCDVCGGKLELVLKGNEEAEGLKKTLKDNKERENRWRVKLADIDATLATVTREKAEAAKLHTNEVSKHTILISICVLSMV